MNKKYGTVAKNSAEYGHRRWLIFLVIIFILGIFTVGCTQQTPGVKTLKGTTAGAATGTVLGAAAGQVGMGAATGAIAGTLLGAHFETRQGLIAALKERNVDAFEVGDHLRIVLYTDYIFKSGTHTIKSDQIETMELVSQLLNTYPTREMYVTGYTDTIFSEKVSRELSGNYAQSIAAYLWTKGINQKKLHVKSGGSKNAIATNKTVFGKAANRRVEIYTSAN